MRDTYVLPLEGTLMESSFMVAAVNELIDRCYHPAEIALTYHLQEGLGGCYYFAKAFPVYLPSKFRRFIRLLTESDLRDRWKRMTHTTLDTFRLKSIQ
jgi:hypothetical protein